MAHWNQGFSRFLAPWDRESDRLKPRFRRHLELLT